MTTLPNVLLLIALTVASMAVAASAAPPTVQYSPGYDARLAEQRKAIAASRQLAPATRPTSRIKRKWRH
jgi:hypothetical protein